MTTTPAAPFPFSAIVAGAWRLLEWHWSAQERLAWIEACIDLGVDTFDHADIYGDYGVHAAFGEALALRPALRSRIKLVSKCGIKLLSNARPEHRVHAYDTSAAHVRLSVDNALRDLRTDRLDLLLIHRPDYLADPQALARVFEDLRVSGKVLRFGVSNHSLSQFDLIHRLTPLVTNQIEFSVLNTQALDDGTLDQALSLGLPPMIWSPLGGGRLFEGDDEQARRVRDALDAIARARGVSAAEVAFAWILRHPARPVPITGSRRIGAIAEAVAATRWSLSSDEWYAVLQASRGRDIP